MKSGNINGVSHSRGLDVFHSRFHRIVFFSPFILHVSAIYLLLALLFHGESLFSAWPPSAECSNQTLNTFAWIGQALIGLASVLKMDG